MKAMIGWFLARYSWRFIEMQFIEMQTDIDDDFDFEFASADRAGTDPVLPTQQCEVGRLATAASLITTLKA